MSMRYTDIPQSSDMDMDDFIRRWITYGTYNNTPVTLYTVLCYTTRRYHHIVAENMEMFTRVCAERFRYSHYINGDEPNWAVIKMRPINAAEHYQMRYGNLCPVCREHHRKPICETMGATIQRLAKIQFLPGESE